MKKSRKDEASVSHHDLLIEDLKDHATAIGYLNTSLESGDEAAFLLALHNVAEAQGGLSRVARLARIHRISLHRIMSREGNPRLHNLANILRALGFKLAVIPERTTKLKHAA